MAAAKSPASRPGSSIRKPSDMTLERGGFVFWNRVLTLSETMEVPELSTEDLQCSLLGIIEGFAHTFDPAEDFPEYATLRLCRSFSDLLERLEQPRTR